MTRSFGTGPRFVRPAILRAKTRDPLAAAGHPRPPTGSSVPRPSSTASLSASPPTPDPFDGLDLSPDLTEAMQRYTTRTRGLEPNEAWRRTNDKRKGIIATAYEQQQRDADVTRATQMSLPDLIKRGGIKGLQAKGILDAATEIHQREERRKYPFTDPGLRRYFEAIGQTPPSPDTPIDGLQPHEKFNLDHYNRQQGRKNKTFDAAHAKHVREDILPWIPLVGNALALLEAGERYADAYRAVRKGDWDEVKKHGGLALLNSVGGLLFGVPGGPAMSKTLKIAAVDAIEKTKMGRQIVSGAKIKKYNKDFDQLEPKIGARDLLGDRFDALPKKTRDALQVALNKAIGRAGETQAARRLRGFTGDGKVVTEGAGRTLTGTIDGEAFRRHYDAVLPEFENTFANRILGVLNAKSKHPAFEVKTRSGHLSNNQARVDPNVRAGTYTTKQQVFPDNVINLRVPLRDIPEADLETAFEVALKGPKFDQIRIRLLEGVRKIRAQELSEHEAALTEKYLTLDLLVGMAARAAAIQSYEEQENPPRGQGADHFPYTTYP